MTTDEPRSPEPPESGTGGAEVNGRSLRSNIGRVASASAIALAFGEMVTLVQTVALARLLTPTEVGLFVGGTVLVLFLGSVSEGGLRAGLIYRDDRLADACETVFWATIISGLAMSGLALLSAPVIGLVFGSATAGKVAAVSAGVLLLFAVTHVPEALLQREFSVRRRLIVGPVVGVTYAGVSVSLAAAGFGVWSMVAGLYASHLAWVLTVWLICRWRPLSGRASVSMWRELARYGFPLVLGTVGERVHSVAETAIVGRVLGAAALGQFRYGQRIAMIPEKAIIEVGAIGLFPAFSRIGSDGARLKGAYLRALHWESVGAAAMSGLMVALGLPAVVVLFGEKWRSAGVVVVAMAGIGLGKALMSVSEEVIKGAGRTRLLNRMTAGEITLGLLLLVVLIGPFGLLGVGLSVSFTALVMGVTSVWLARPIVGCSIRELFGAVYPVLPTALVATAAAGLLEHLVFHSDTRALPVAVGLLATGGLVFSVAYLAALAIFAPPSVKTLFSRGFQVLGRVRS